MSTIIDWLGSHLLQVAEYEFVKAEPAMKEELITQMKVIIGKIESWIMAEIEAKKSE